MANTLTIAKTVGLTDYNEPFRVEGDKNLWPYGDIYEIGTTRRGQEKYYGYAGLPIAQKRGEGEPFPVYDMSELGETTVLIHKFMIATRMSREAIQDAVHIRNIAAEIGAMQGESHAQAEAQFASLPFNLFTDADNFPMHDNLSMISASHTLENGATYDNDYTATAISHDNVWDDLIAYEWGYRNHAGLRVRDQVKQIVVASNAVRAFTKILENSKEPDTMDQNDSFLLRKGIKLIVNPFLTSSTARFYLGSKFKKAAKFIWRERLQTDQDEDKINQGVYFLSWFRAGIGVIDYLSIAYNSGV